MRIIIRVDASQYMGTGHVMRCLTLAQVLKSEGHKVIFVCRDLPGNLINKIIDQGFICKVLAFDSSLYDQSHYADEYAFWLSVTQEQDAVQTLEVIDDCDWVVVDHYGLDATWESQLRRVAKRIMVIDDLANRSHDCDVLLDQNYYQNAEQRYTDLVPKRCKLILGPHYALLRPEFVRLREQCNARRHIKSILITYGGTDEQGVSLTTLNSILPEIKQQQKVVVLAGPNWMTYQELLLTAEANPNVEIVSLTPKIADYMSVADFCFGAGGSTTWERCCLGLPTAITILAHNQRDIALQANQAGFAYSLGEYNQDDYAQKCLSVLRGMGSDLLSKMSQKAFMICDGYGAHNTVRSLCHFDDC